MAKKEFINKLKDALEGLPENEINERISFYSDMIDDRIEDGMSEEEAVNDVGSVEEIKTQIMSDVSLVKIVKHKIKPKRRLRVGEIVALAITSPIWVALLIAAFAVIVAVFVSLWAVVIGLFAGDVALGFGGLVGGITNMIYACVEGAAGNGIAMLGVGIIALGLSFMLVAACISLTKAVVKLIKWTILKIKYCLVGGKKDE